MMSMQLRFGLLILIGLHVASCGGDSPSEADATSVIDGATEGSSPADTGQTVFDAASGDTGESNDDAALADSGEWTSDAALADGSEADTDGAESDAQVEDAGPELDGSTDMDSGPISDASDPDASVLDASDSDGGSPDTGNDGGIDAGGSESPVVDQELATPARARNNGTQVLLTARARDPDGSVQSVTVDLTSLGGSGTTAMVDDGSNGDATPNDGVFAATVVVSSSAPVGSQRLAVLATDNDGAVGFGTIALEVQPPTPMWRPLLPPTRANRVAVYDAANDRVVMFGGSLGIWIYDNDVWTWTAQRGWALLDLPEPRPLGSFAPSTIYDPVGHRMILFGGTTPEDFRGPMDEVWALSLEPGRERWVQLSPSGQGPTARSGAAAVYDPTGLRMIIFGGFDETGSYKNDLWALELSNPQGVRWRDITPNSGLAPAPAAYAGFAFDSINERAVLFGGWDGIGDTSQLWSLDLSRQRLSWTDLNQTADLRSYSRTPNLQIPDDDPVGVSDTIQVSESLTAASVRVLVDITHTYIWDLQVTLEHGGRSMTLLDHPGSGGQNLMHEFTASEFEGMDTAGPWTLTVRDTSAQDVGVLNSWRLSVSETIIPRPEPRDLMAFFHDAQRQRFLAFGGINGLTGLNDLWSLSSGATPAWTQIHPAASPSPRSSAASVFMPSMSRLWVHGGTMNTEAEWGAGPTHVDLWQLDASLPGSESWTQLEARPSGRFIAAAALDSVRSRMIVYGGKVETGASPAFLPTTDLWQLAFQPEPTWTEITSGGEDFSAHRRRSFCSVFAESRRELVVGAGADGDLFVSGSGVLSFASIPPTWRHIPAGQDTEGVFDAVNDRVVLYGGWMLDPIRDVLAIGLDDGSSSLLAPTGTAPQPFFGHSAVYDRLNQRMIIFGGTSELGNDAAITDEVSALSLVAGQEGWSRVTVAGPGPLPRGFAKAVVTPSHKMFIFGGTPLLREDPVRGQLTDPFTDVWRLELTAGSERWSEVTTGGIRPEPRLHASVAYDPVENRLLVVGGIESIGGESPDYQLTSDVWELRYLDD